MRKQLTILFFILASTQLWALDAPVLISPKNHLDDAYTRQTFKWNSVSDAGGYQIEVDTTKKFNSPLLRSETWSSTSASTFSVKMTDFYFHTHYYWRVRAISKTDQEVTSAWSEVWDMTTVSRPTLVSPNNADETATYFPTQTLTWKNSRGCTAYTIEIDTVPTFDSPAKTRETWSHTATEDETKSCEVKNLYLGKMNYWRLKVYNKNDSSDWSQTYRFHTLSKAKGESPNNLTNALTTQTFEWTYYKGLNNVIIELDTTNRFNSPAKRTVNSSGSSEDYCYQNISEMYFGKDYYWRVRSCHQKDTTEWSDVLHFQTYNFCTLSTPKDGATDQIVSGKIWWKWHKGVSTYQVQMDTTSSFNSPSLINKMEGASSDDYAYYSYSELLFGQRYFWRVRECHSKDTSIWSETRTFITYHHCYLTKAPLDSATEVITSPQLNFNYTDGISKYQMQLDTTPLFNSALLQDHIESASSQTYAYHVYNDLLFGTTYYRRVRECHSKDTSGWSPVCCFTTIVRGAYSTNSSYASIANGATGIAIRPKLYYCYRSYIDSVEIQIDTTEQFDSPLFQSIRAQASTVQSYAYEYPKSDLLYGTTYYWRIRNSHSKDVSDWTFPRYFTTVGLSPAPTLVGPENKSIIFCDDSTQFSWKAYTNATAYTMQLSDKSSFDSIWEQINASDTMVNVQLKKDVTYYWRVQASTAQGRSKWSEVWMLSTKDSSSLYTLEPPVLTWPDSVVNNAYTRQQFKWNAVEGAGKYVFQVDTNRSFTTPTINDTLTERDVMRYHFRYGKTHYWRVRALSATSAMELSHWSEVRRFTTVKAPTLSSPNDSDPEGYYNPKQTFRWNNSCGSNLYVIEIDTCPGFDSPAKKRVKESTYASNDDKTLSTEVGNLYLGKMTYWRVKAYNNNDSSEWSKPYQFHTLNWAACSSPADSAKNQYTTRYLYWKRIEGLPYVILELDTTAGFDSSIKRTITSWAYYDDDANTQVTQMLFGTTYYWRVRYHHNCDTTVWSPVRTFTTYDWGTHGSSPANGSSNISVTPKLYIEHTNYISIYFVQIDTALTFDSPLVREQKVESSADYPYWQVKDTLLYGTTYYWRVKDAHTKDTSNWSKPWAFTTTYQLTQPSLCEPANQTTVINDEAVYFVWNTCEDAIKYIYQLSDDGQFRTYLHQEILTDTTTSLIPPHNSILYWRVQAINSKGRSPWSKVRGLNTTTPQPTLLNDNHNDNHNPIRKVLINGHLYIIKDDKRYDATGSTID